MIIAMKIISLGFDMDAASAEMVGIETERREEEAAKEAKAEERRAAAAAAKGGFYAGLVLPPVEGCGL